MIVSESIACCASMVSAAHIDSHGIVGSTRLAMRTAIAGLEVRPEFVLVDAVPLADLPMPHRAVVKGDDLSISIAAASIVAKVVRDWEMRVLDRRYPGYGLARHKGYPTAEHVACLTAFGPCLEHRRTFRPVAELVR